MAATVRLSSHARKSYEKLARSDRRLFVRVDRALDRLAGEPDSGKPLYGPLRGKRSFRVGTVRIIYRYEHSELLVLAPVGRTLIRGVDTVRVVPQE